MSDSLQHRLHERVKELTALHRTARLLQDVTSPLDVIVPAVTALLPPAWMHPDVAEGSVRCGDRRWSTPGFRETPWLQRETFRLRDGRTGDITVVYREERPAAAEGPFLTEERELIRSLAEMLRAWFQHRIDDTALLALNDSLERQVAERTASLRRLASEVSLAEERERRRIAEDLHDHLGQALAVIKIRLQTLRGDAMFGGHDGALAELVALSDQAIRYTRGLTFELSPPILYELGLGPALEWLGEDTTQRHGLRVKMHDRARCALPDDLKVMLWKSARELLHNVVKHAGARTVGITLDQRDGAVILEIADDGRGFDPALARRDAGAQFGLFSIEERLRQLGGHMELETGPGRGTRVRLTAGIPGGDR
jgi:signal transduction histidine kinase